MENIELEPCPCCKGDVNLSTTRDLNILETHVDCEECDINFFVSETPTGHGIKYSRAEEIACDKLVSKAYNRFCLSKPTHYKDHSFEDCEHDRNYYR